MSHLQKHELFSTGDHDPGTASTVIGTDVGSALAEVPFSSASTSGSLVQYTGTGQVNVPTTPVSPNDAASKAYVDAIAAGLVPHTSVRVATTGPGALATDYEAGDTIDGIVLVLGNRILIKDQVSAIDNGLYVVNAVGAPSRAADLPVGATANGASVFIDFGTANDGSTWFCTAPAGSDIVGTDPLPWSQFLAPANAGDGLDRVSNTFMVAPTVAAVPQQYGAVVVNRTASGTGVAAANEGYAAVQTDNTSLDVDGSNRLRVKPTGNAGLFQGVFSYAGADPVFTGELDQLTALHQYAFFKKGALDPTYLAFRRSTAAGTIDDFALVEMDS